MGKSLNHIHTLLKLDKSHRRCGDPHCYYTVNNEEIRGKASLCGICGIKEVVMNCVQLKLRVPRCEDCSNRKVDVVKRRIRNTLEQLEKEGIQL